MDNIDYANLLTICIYAILGGLNFANNKISKFQYGLVWSMLMLCLLGRAVQ